MRYHKSNLSLLLLLGCLLFLTPFRDAYGQENAADTATPQAEIESVIKTLENPAAREELVRQLKVMAQAQQQTPSENQVKSAASQALQDISRRLSKISDSAMALAGNINHIPQLIAWFKAEMKDQQSRQMWTEILVNLTITLGLGYLAFYIFRWGLLHFRRTVANNQTNYCLLQIVRLLGIFLLDCLPILAFAVAAYLTLSLVGSQLEKTKLVALAWINAFIIVQAIMAVCHLIFSPSSPGLRCIDLSDETANYLLIWGNRLSFVATYGYFALQAALLLDLPQLSYDILLRLLGLLVTVLVIIMILQNRERMTHYLLKWSTGALPEPVNITNHQGIRYRLALNWHLLTIAYVALLFGVWALQVEGGFVYLTRATLLTLVVMLIIRLVMRVLNAVFTRGFQLNEDLKTRFPDLEERANRYTNTLHMILNVGVYFLGIMSLLQAWGVNTFGWLSSEPGKALSRTIIVIFGILLISFLIWEVVNSLIESYLNRKDGQGHDLEASARTKTLLTVARKALTITLTIVSTLMVLSELGVDIAPLLAGAGVLGLAIGFGAQKLVQDVITGVFILLEDQIAVGDVVSVGDKAGLVEAVSIRTLRLRDLSGTVHTIPFSAISIVSNLTKDFSFYVMEVGVAYRENADEVMQILRELGAELQQNEEYGPFILEPLEVLGVDSFADSAVVIKARIKTTPIKQWWVGREFNRRMKQRFDERGIEIPFPHRTIYFGENKGGGAPPAMVQVEAGPRELSPEAGHSQKNNKNDPPSDDSEVGDSRHAM